MAPSDQTALRIERKLAELEASPLVHLLQKLCDSVRTAPSALDTSGEQRNRETCTSAPQENPVEQQPYATADDAAPLAADNVAAESVLDTSSWATETTRLLLRAAADDAAAATLEELEEKHRRDLRTLLDLALQRTFRDSVPSPECKTLTLGQRLRWLRAVPEYVTTLGSLPTREQLHLTCYMSSALVQSGNTSCDDERAAVVLAVLALLTHADALSHGQYTYRLLQFAAVGHSAVADRLCAHFQGMTAEDLLKVVMHRQAGRVLSAALHGVASQSRQLALQLRWRFNTAAVQAVRCSGHGLLRAGQTLAAPLVLLRGLVSGWQPILNYAAREDTGGLLYSGPGLTLLLECLREPVAKEASEADHREFGRLQELLLLRYVLSVRARTPRLLAALLWTDAPAPEGTTHVDKRRRLGQALRRLAHAKWQLCLPPPAPGVERLNSAHRELLVDSQTAESYLDPSQLEALKCEYSAEPAPALSAVELLSERLLECKLPRVIAEAGAPRGWLHQALGDFSFVGDGTETVWTADTQDRASPCLPFKSALPPVWEFLSPGPVLELALVSTDQLLQDLLAQTCFSGTCKGTDKLVQELCFRNCFKSPCDALRVAGADFLNTYLALRDRAALAA